MEKKVINHFCHEHPLILTENVSHGKDCYGCGNPVSDSEMAYVCMEQQHCTKKTIILHKKCGELAIEIRHPKHPDHPIQLFDFHNLRGHLCDLCRGYIGMVLGYRCSSCDFDLDITCDKIGIDALLEEERKELQHPSHPDHPLTLMRKPAFSFYCDGCGEQGVDMAYICSTCEFWVHKACASLPLVLPDCSHHHHHLSLTFSLPVKHRKYAHACDVCDEYFDKTCWIYFCGDCRYFAHIKCVAGSSSTTKPDPNSSNEDDDDDCLRFPLDVHDIYKELIKPFVMRELQGGLDAAKDIMPAATTASSRYHEHHLSLVSEEDEEEDDELKKICEVCVTPISSPPYYECATCTSYFIHSICYLLPTTLHSSSEDDSQYLLQLYGGCKRKKNENHKFTLYTSSKSYDKDAKLYRCELCGFLTNGMGYECAECKMKIDVKCASLPIVITHASHPHHKPLILTRIPPQEYWGRRNECNGCETTFDDDYDDDGRIGYRCGRMECDFALELQCALLPLSITEHEWDDEHPLWLTFDASLDHPSDFFCEFCEEEMHPKRWMYHCRLCDLSFHVYCLKNASRDYRNIKFGCQFELDGIHPHPHPLTFNYVTLKKRCDRCRRDAYTYPGFECASCYYVVCWDCGRRKLGKI